MEVKFHKKNKKTDKILKRTSVALIREAIQDTRRTLDDINKKLLKLHLKLSNQLHPLLWQTADQLSNFRSHTDTDLTTKKQKRKFEKLKEKQKPDKRIEPLDSTKLVHNISSFQLDYAEESVLAKGFNFAVAPARIPVEDIICEVEASISELPSTTADTIRQDIVRILRNAKTPKKNLSREEHLALQKLKKNQNIIILPADKGNTTVVMDFREYESKMQALLQDGTYQLITTDPTTYLEKTTKTKIKSSQINKDEQQKLIPREKSSKCPKLYGLPKIHKEGTPLRPIVSSIKSPTQDLAKYLAKKLQPYAEEADSYVRNAAHFIERIRDIKLEPGHMLVSFDVVSLFTNVPVNEALDILQVEHQVREDIVELVKHCLMNTYFIFNNQRYKQIQGAPMGSPLSPVISNLFMKSLEERAIETAILKPKLWLRYVDDTFIIWTHGEKELMKFLHHLNGMHQDIKFTMETEKNNRLPFLDVLVYKKEDGKLGHTVYRKPTHTNRYLNAKSHHHPAQLHSVAKTLITRSQRLADEQNKKEELQNIEKTLQQNGFSTNDIKRALKPRRQRKEDVDEEQDKTTPRAYLPYIKGTTDKISKVLKQANIVTSFKTVRKISQILPNAKTKIDLEAQGVYEIPCKDCERSYVGQTNRRINVRREEHRNAVRKKEKTSSLAEHVTNTLHEVDFENTRIIASIEHKTKRIIREAIEIEKRPTNLNRRDDTQRLPAAWKPALLSLRTHKIKNPPTTNETAKSPKTQSYATDRNTRQVYNNQAALSGITSRLTRSRAAAQHRRPEDGT